MSDDPQHRSTYTNAPEGIEVREADDDQRWMDIRLPIASTGEVRNEGDDPLTRSELRGMAEQLNTNRLGVFPEHGQSDLIDFAGYSQFEKLGYWTGAEVEREAADDGEDILYATARVLDPEPLPTQTGTYRQALSILREQAAAGMPITTSIGWREDEDAPGGNDLLEVSIVGIAADPRTGTEGGQALIARAAVEAGADPDALVDAVRAAVGSDGADGDRDTDDMTETQSESGEQSADDETADEQHDADAADADAEETETRAADDVTLQDFADLLAPSLAEADASDLLDAWEGFEYTGAADLDAVAGFVSTVTDADMDATENALDDLMGGEQADDDDDGEEEDDEDEEQSADAEGEDGDRDADPDLEQRLADLEDELAAVRAGEVDIDTPDPGDEDSSEEERDADDGEPDDDTEQRDTDDDTDPADKPAWAV